TVTGAIGTMTAGQLVETVTSNPIKAMQNRLAGVDITNAGNKPGDQASIRIRGTPSTTMSGSLPAGVDRTPRIRMLAWSPGLLPAFVMSTPASRSCIALIGLEVAVSTSLS